MKTEPLVKGKYYHIYNRGNNSADIFFDEENYKHFLNLYGKYIHPIADTFAWCLMKNHFHFLVYLKEDNEIDKSELTYSTVDMPKEINPSKQFSHLFNAYTQAINKRYKRTGSLFEKNFERKIVDSGIYFTNLIYYIHTNPVHHNIENNISSYKWSSYKTILSSKSTKLKREEVLGYFNDIDNFIYCHNQQHDFEQFKNILIDYF